MKKRYTALLFSVLLLPMLLHARAEGHFDRTLSVSGAVNLDLTTGSGDVVIKAGNANQVVIHGTVRGNNEWFSSADSAVHQLESNPPIQQSGSSIRIGYDLPEDVKRHVAISYDVTVPPNTTVQAHSGSGDMEVTGVRSEVQAHSGSGEIQLRDLGGRVNVQTGSGNIRAQSVGAPFTAQTGSGDIEASLTTAGDVDVHTGSGTIRVNGIKGAVQVHTGSGDIETNGEVTGPWRLHSGSGTIRMALGTGGGFNLDVHTSSGSIHSDLPITVQGSLGGHELKGSVRGGGPQVEVSTSSGDVNIR